MIASAGGELRRGGEAVTHHLHESLDVRSNLGLRISKRTAFARSARLTNRSGLSSPSPHCGGAIGKVSGRAVPEALGVITKAPPGCAVISRMIVRPFPARWRAIINRP